MPNSIPLIREAISRCKALLRNGYDAYVINAMLQSELIRQGLSHAVDIASAADFATMAKIFPTLEVSTETGVVGVLHEEEMTFYFYATDIEHASHPELGLTMLTPRMISLLSKDGRNKKFLTYAPEKEVDPLYGFEDPERTGNIRLEGLPSRTLRRNYILAVRALRLAANMNLPVEPNTWLSIVQAANRILDYVPTKEIMDEWRHVEAKNMHCFVRLLSDTHLLHGIVPEIAALKCVTDQNDGEADAKENVFDHTIECMRAYPEGEWEHDWLGTLAVLFHDVGKLYTGEHSGHWTFYQHHRVGAGVTRKILRRLHFTDEDIDLVCGLVRNHMHFHFMLTDRGIRRFTTLDETRRLIAICRADIQARGSSTTNYNHNSKYLERAETAEIMLEPLLNGNEIMEYTSLPPGPMVGMLRESLLKAQISGEVTDLDSAVAFVRKHAQ